MSYDLIKFVKKLHKVHKNPKHALDVVKGFANFSNFHGFGIEKIAVVEDGRLLQHGGKLVPREGLCFSQFLQRCLWRWLC